MSLFLAQVNFSQTLGVVGYSLLPLVIVASVLPVVHSLPAVSSCLKVGCSFCLIVKELTVNVLEVWVCSCELIVWPSRCCLVFQSVYIKAQRNLPGPKTSMLKSLLL